MDSSLGVQLIDTGKDFIVKSSNSKVKIKYGEFALSLINVDYDKMNGIISKFVTKNRILRVAEDLQGSSDIIAKGNIIQINELLLLDRPDIIDNKKIWQLAEDLQCNLDNSAINSISQIVEEFQSNPNIINHKQILRLAEILQSKRDKSNKISPEIVNMITPPLYKPFQKYLACYLDERQSRCVSKLLISEIKNRLLTGIIALREFDRYLPSIFADKNLNKHIKNILLKKKPAFMNPIQSMISQVEITSTIVMTKDGKALTSYHLDSTLDYLIIDLQKYLSGKNTVKECLCCHRLFYPSRSSNKYCRLKRTDSKYSCAVIAHRGQGDEFSKAKVKASGEQYSLTHNDSVKKKYKDDFFLNNLYQDWSDECKEKCIDCRREEDLEGFKKWINETKYRANRLKEKYQEYLDNKANAD